MVATVDKSGPFHGHNLHPDLQVLDLCACLERITLDLRRYNAHADRNAASTGHTHSVANSHAYSSTNTYSNGDARAAAQPNSDYYTNRDGHSDPGGVADPDPSPSAADGHDNARGNRAGNGRPNTGATRTCAFAPGTR